MPSKVTGLKSQQTTAQIEAGDGTIDIQLPLTLAGWDITEVAASYGSRQVVVTSADGDHFLGEVTGMDQDRYILTVELS